MEGELCPLGRLLRLLSTLSLLRLLINERAQVSKRSKPSGDFGVTMVSFQFSDLCRALSVWLSWAGALLSYLSTTAFPWWAPHCSLTRGSPAVTTPTLSTR